METFHEGQKIWVEQEDGSQRPGIFVGAADIATWFGGGPGVYVVYPDTRSGEEVRRPGSCLATSSSRSPPPGRSSASTDAGHRSRESHHAGARSDVGGWHRRGDPRGRRADAVQHGRGAASRPEEHRVHDVVDPEGGRVMFIGLFPSEDDLRASEAVLAQMDPPEGMGTRTAVDVYEVAAEARL